MALTVSCSLSRVSPALMLTPLPLAAASFHFLQKSICELPPVTNINRSIDQGFWVSSRIDGGAAKIKAEVGSEGKGVVVGDGCDRECGRLTHIH